MALNLRAKITLQDDFTRPMRKAHKQLQRSTQAASRMSDGMNRVSRATRRVKTSTASSVGTFVKLAGAVGAAALAYKGLQTSIQGAMELETNRITLEALVKDAEKANQLFELIQQKALMSTFDERGFQSAAKAILPLTKNIDQINRSLEITERLAASNPLEGMEGAAYSLREVLSGDYTSIVERFNLPRSVVKEALDGADTMSEKLSALDKVLTNMGYTQEFINRVNKSATSQWKILSSNVSLAMAQMGSATLEKLKQPLTEINKWISSGGLDFIKERGSSFLAGATQRAIDFFQFTSGAFAVLSGDSRKAVERFSAVFGALDGGTEKVKKAIAFFENMRGTLSTVKDAFLSVYNGAKKAGTWIIDNWPAVKPVVLSVAAGMITLKASLKGLTVYKSITRMIDLYKTSTFAATVAQKGFNAALRANPIGLVITAITALVTAGVYLWQNWDTIKEKAQALWQKIKGVWDNIKDKTSRVWYDVKVFVVDAINGIIDKINWLIEKINKIPGVKVPIIPKVEAPKMPDSVAQGSGLTPMAARGPVPGNYHGLDYVPRDNYLTRLHKGEAVLPRKEAENYRKGNNQQTVIIRGNNFYIREEADIDKVVNGLVRKIEPKATAMA